MSFSYYDHSTHGSFNTNPNPKSLQTQSTGSPEFGCFVNVEFEEEPLPWKYWSIVLDYPKGIVKKAEGKKLKVKLRVHEAGTDSLSRLANCIIPRTPVAVTMLEKMMLNDTDNKRTASSLNSTSSIGNSDTVSDMPCNEQDGNGFNCPEGACWTSEEKVNCRWVDSGILVLPELVVTEEEEEPVGPGEPPPGPNNPPPPDDGDSGDDGTGGGGEPCYSCEPSDDPCPPKTAGPPLGVRWKTRVMSRTHPTGVPAKIPVTPIWTTRP